jgi:SAM-dependent methyltransferase
VGVAVSLSLDPVDYGAWFASPLGRRVWADEERALLKLLRPRAGWRVLDTGCGDGRLLLSLARQGLCVVGVDASAAMLHRARDRARAAGLPIRLVCADVGALPFHDEAFDAVAAVTVLCFVGDVPPVLREMARTVRRGGRLVIGELGRWSSWAAWRRIRGWRRGGPWDAAVFWSARGLRRIARAAGLVPRSARGAVFYLRSAWGARLFSPLDALLGAVTTVGAAFVAVAADTPVTGTALHSRGSRAERRPRESTRITRRSPTSW